MVRFKSIIRFVLNLFNVFPVNYIYQFCIGFNLLSFLIVGCVFLLLCLTTNFWLNIRYCEFDLGCWIFLSFCKYSWDVFWDKSLIFLSLPFQFVDAIRVRFSRVNYSLLQGKTLLYILTSMPWIMRLFSIASRDRHYLLLECRVFPLMFSSISFPLLLLVTLYARADLCSEEYSRETLCRSLQFSLHAAISFMLLCLANSSCFNFSQQCLPNSKSWLCMSFPFQCNFWKLSK